MNSVKISLGVAEVAVAILAVVISIGGSWVVTKEQLAKVSEISGNNRAELAIIKDFTRSNTTDIVLLKERGEHLARATDSYKDSVVGLSAVLNDLNNTLARMDERMKNLEEALRSGRG